MTTKKIDKPSTERERLLVVLAWSDGYGRATGRGVHGPLNPDEIIDAANHPEWQRVQEALEYVRKRTRDG